MNLKKYYKIAVRLCVLTLVLFVILASGCSSPAQNTAPPEQTVSTDQDQADSAAAAVNEAADFYKGKILTFIVPVGVGGNYDMMSRILAPYLEKYTGATVVVKNVEGGGSIIGTNQLYSSAPDGLTMGILQSMALVNAQLVGQEGVNFDLLKFDYVGRLTTDTRVLAINTNSQFKTFDDILNASAPVKFGATGLGAVNYVDAVVIGETLGIPSDIIPGYDSSNEVNLAILRGEVEGAWGSLASNTELVANGDIFLVLQSGKERNQLIPDIPTWFEYSTSEESTAILSVYDSMHAVGRSIAVAPGVPAERLEFLRDAFYKSLQEPGFIEDMEKLGSEVLYLAGDELKDLFKVVFDMPEDTKEFIIKANQGE